MIKNFDELYEKLSQHIDDKNRDTVDLLRQEFRGQLTSELQKTKKEIVVEVSDAIGNGIIPQLESHDEKFKNHESRILSLEEKTKV